MDRAAPMQDLQELRVQGCGSIGSEEGIVSDPAQLSLIPLEEEVPGPAILAEAADLIPELRGLLDQAMAGGTLFDIVDVRADSIQNKFRGGKPCAIRCFSNFLSLLLGRSIDLQDLGAIFLGCHISFHRV